MQLFAGNITFHPALFIELNLAIGGQRGTHPLPSALQAGFDGGESKVMQIGIVLLPHAVQVALLDDVAVFLR